MPTGLKFIVLTDPKQLGMDNLLKKIYELYSDFALKNPFYSLDMPIRLVLNYYCKIPKISFKCVVFLTHLYWSLLITILEIKRFHLMKQ